MSCRWTLFVCEYGPGSGFVEWDTAIEPLTNKVDCWRWGSLASLRIIIAFLSSSHTLSQSVHARSYILRLRWKSDLRPVTPQIWRLMLHCASTLNAVHHLQRTALLPWIWSKQAKKNVIASGILMALRNQYPVVACLLSWATVLSIHELHRVGHRMTIKTAMNAETAFLSP